MLEYARIRCHTSISQEPFHHDLFLPAMSKTILILFDKLDINEGMLMENIVAQMLRRQRPRLYFYSRSDSQKWENHMEIDFLITEGKKIAPVEVKSGNYRSHSSLDKFRKHFSSVIGSSYILYTKDVMIKDGIIHLPLYMAELL